MACCSRRIAQFEPCTIQSICPCKLIWSVGSGHCMARSLQVRLFHTNSIVRSFHKYWISNFLYMVRYKYDWVLLTRLTKMMNCLHIYDLELQLRVCLYVEYIHVVNHIFICSYVYIISITLGSSNKLLKLLKEKEKFAWVLSNKTRRSQLKYREGSW